MVAVYFDRNVFADICELRNGLTPEDVAKVQYAVRSGSVMIPASVTLFEETINIIRGSEEDYVNHMRTLLSLVNKQVMIKPVNELIIEDCTSYAEKSPYHRTMPTPPKLISHLDPSANKEDLLRTAEEVTERFRDLSVGFTQGLLDAREEGLRRAVGRPDSYSELWEGTSKTIMEGCLNKCSRNIRRLCKKRGLDGMLEVRSLRIHAIYYVWFMYAGWFGLQGAPKKVDPGDIGDWSHAIQASSTNILVTQESKTKTGKIPSILGQVPINNFEVINLQEFLRRI